MDTALFLDICRENSLPCGEPEARKLSDFADFLLAENEKYNLTAIREERALMLRHLCDSMTVIPLIPEGARVLDIGSGAGFPALPLALLRPDVNVTALDATAKKTSFINAAASKLALSNLAAVSGRAEELAHDPAYREAFDIVTARAVSRLSVLSELAAGFIKPGCRLLAMKGDPSTTEDELRAAEKICRALSLSHEETKLLTLTDAGAGEELSRSIVIMKKTAPTPASYPRRYSQIIKN